MTSLGYGVLQALALLFQAERFVNGARTSVSAEEHTRFRLETFTLDKLRALFLEIVRIKPMRTLKLSLVLSNAQLTEAAQCNIELPSFTHPSTYTGFYNIKLFLLCGTFFLTGCNATMWGSVLQGMAEGMNQSNRTISHTPQQQANVYEPETKTCSNDYGCSYGSTCVKDQFKMQGFCAKKVDAYGIQTLTPPNPDSVYLGGEGDCSFDTDCPIGFKCVKGQGQLKGYCLK